MKNKLYLATLIFLAMPVFIGFSNIQKVALGIQVCGWVDDYGTGPYIVVSEASYWYPGESFDLYLEGVDKVNELKALGIPGNFILYDPVIVEVKDYYAITNFSNIEKVNECEPSSQNVTPTSPPIEAGDICGIVEMSDIYYGWGPVFKPYNSRSPSEWLTFHQLGIYVFDLGRDLLPDELASLSGNYLRIWGLEFEEGTLIAIDGYEVVESCELFPTDEPMPENAKLEITNIAIADILTQDAFMASQLTTYILKQNTFWVQVTNVGQERFAPSGGNDLYALQVILKQFGGKLEDQEFTPISLLSLEPLKILEPGESQNLLVSDLFFFNTVENADLEVLLKPDPSLGIPNSIFEKKITIENHPDSYCACAATLAKEVIRIASLKLGGVSLRLAELGAGIVEAGCKGDMWEMASTIANWLIGALGDLGQIFSAILDIARELAKSEIPCMKVSDWINASLHQMFLNGYKSNGIITQSPVYPLVINEAGQRAGFLENGQIVQEIPDSQVTQIGESRIILFIGEDAKEIHVTGYSAGTMNLYTTLAHPDGYVYMLSYENVQVTEVMEAILLPGESEHNLSVDSDGDGESDLLYSPEKTDQISTEGTPKELSTSTSTPNTPQTVQQPGICGGAIGLMVLPIFMLAFRLHCQKKKPSNHL